MRPTAAAVRRSLALAGALACVAPAGASALTLGTTERPGTGGGGFAAARCDQPAWGTGHVFYQSATLLGLPSSQAPSSGSITSWRTDQFGGGDPGGTIALAIVRPTPSGITITAIDVQTLPAVIPREDVVFTPSPPVPIAAGDFIGIWGPDDRSGCSFTGGRPTEAYTRAPIGPTLSVGGPFPSGTRFNNRVNLSAELAVGVGVPTPPTPPDPPAPPPGPGPTEPEPPRFDPYGRPFVSGRGDALEVGTGQRVGCAEAGPCRVVATAVTYFTTGGVRAAAAAAARRGARARRRGRARPRAVVVGRRTFTVAAGGSAAVSFPLNRAGKTRLRQLGRLRLVVTTTVTQAGTAPVVSRRTFSISAPGGRRRAAGRRPRR